MRAITRSTRAGPASGGCANLRHPMLADESRRDARPARVLQVLTCDGVGGTEHMVASLVEHLDREQVACDVVTLDAPGPIAARLRAAGVPVRSLGGGFARALPRLARAVRAGGYDVVNAYGFKATAAARLITRVLSPGSAFVAGVRALHPSEVERMDTPKARFVLTLERLGARWVDVYDANSAGAVELLAGLGVPRERLTCIPNGLDAARWPLAAPAGGDRCTILCVARMVPRKRHVDLLEASAVLHGRGVPHRLVLAGDGPLRAELQARAAALGIDGHAEFPGRLAGEALRRCLAGSHVSVLVSTLEGMSTSVMEAMACGLPVVGSDVNGIRDLVVDGETGLLVPPKSPVELAAALERLVAGPALRATLGAAGRRRLEREFSLEAMVAAKGDLYRRLAGVG